MEEETYITKHKIRACSNKAENQEKLKIEESKKMKPIVREETKQK